MPPLDGNSHNPPASGLDDVAPDNSVLAPVGTFDQYVRLKRRDQDVRRILVENDGRIHAVERHKDLGPLRLWRQRPIRSLIGSNGMI